MDLLNRYFCSPRTFIPAAVIVAVSFAMVPTASLAQLNVGGQIAYASDNVNLGVGVRGIYSMSKRVENLALETEFTLFFPEDGGNLDVDYWDFGINLLYSIAIPESPNIIPYAIGGLGIGKLSVKTDGVGSIGGGNTEAGLNIGAGVRSKLNRITPFGEIRANIGSDRPDIVALVGLTLPIGGKKD